MVLSCCHDALGMDHMGLSEVAHILIDLTLVRPLRAEDIGILGRLKWQYHGRRFTSERKDIVELSFTELERLVIRELNPCGPSLLQSDNPSHN